MKPSQILHRLRTLLILLMAVASVGCSRSPQVILGSRGIAIDGVQWTEEERAKEIAHFDLRESQWASHAILRMNGAEKPHYHARHDLFVIVLKGRVRMHLGDQVYVMKPGDSVDIPHGMTHWAENIHRKGSEAYVMFTPPLTEADSVPVGPLLDE